MGAMDPNHAQLPAVPRDGTGDGGRRGNSSGIPTGPRGDLSPAFTPRDVPGCGPGPSVQAALSVWSPSHETAEGNRLECAGRSGRNNRRWALAQQRQGGARPLPLEPEPVPAVGLAGQPRPGSGGSGARGRQAPEPRLCATVALTRITSCAPHKAIHLSNCGSLRRALAGCVGDSALKDSQPVTSTCGGSPGPWH